MYLHTYTGFLESKQIFKEISQTLRHRKKDVEQRNREELLCTLIEVDKRIHVKQISEVKMKEQIKHNLQREESLLIYY